MCELISNVLLIVVHVLEFSIIRGAQCIALCLGMFPALSQRRLFQYVHITSCQWCIPAAASTLYDVPVRGPLRNHSDVFAAATRVSVVYSDARHLLL